MSTSNEKTSPTSGSKRENSAADQSKTNNGTEAKKQKHEYRTPPMRSLDEIMQQWSPEEVRVHRAVELLQTKIRVGALRGGDYVLNSQGDSATLSCCFKVDQYVYGLTVGHLVNRVGDDIFAFVSEEPLPNNEGGDSSPVYETRAIGSVVSISYETDSLVFLFNSDIETIPMKLAPESGLKGDLVFPKPSLNPPPPTAGEILIGFAAQRRGAFGEVSTPSLDSPGQYSFMHDIGIVFRSPNEETGSKSLTDGGDCGALFLDMEGNPLYFHHVIRRTPSTGKHESFGVPFARVMAFHEELGGSSHSESRQGNAMINRVGSEDWEEEAPLQHFNVKIKEHQQAFQEYAGLGARVNMKVMK